MYAVVIQDKQTGLNLFNNKTNDVANVTVSPVSHTSKENKKPPTITIRPS